MRDYELTVLLKPTLTEKELDKEVKSLTDIFSKAGVKIARKTDPKKQILAYEIADNREAYYAFFELELKPETVGQVDQKLKLQDNVIRYLIVCRQNP